jgi:hypothetical protein
MSSSQDSKGVPGERGQPVTVVTCAGRSGSKWVQQLLDLSPTTLCRNEPHRIDPVLSDPDAADWFEHAILAGHRIGIHDLRPESVKSIVRPLARSLRLDRLVYSRASRVLWRRRGTVAYPALIYDRGRFDEMHLVLKIINARHLVCRLLREQEPVRVVHVMRHPGGMLNSWLKRYASRFDPSDILLKQREVLSKIHAIDPAYAALTGPADSLSLGALKLWCWRHAQEDMIRHGDGRSAYTCVVFEKLAEDPVGQVARLYERIGLGWSDSVGEGVLRLTGRSQSIAGAWRDGLASEQAELVDEILGGSQLLSGMFDG